MGCLAKSAGELFSTMVSHVRGLKGRIPDASLQSLSFEIEDNPNQYMIGFRCPVTSEVFSISMMDIKRAGEVNDSFRTIDGRKVLASYLWDNGLK